MDETPPRKRHLNADERSALRAAEVHRFAKLYGRKAQRGIEPNDRRYDRDAERRIKQMSPEAFDRVLREDE